MAEFEVRGLDAAGKLARRTIRAGDADSARRQAADLDIVQVRALSGPVLSRAPRFDLSLFAQELLTLLDAGLSLIEALDVLADRAGTDDTLPGLIRSLREGLSFSRALAEQPARFPDLFVASMAASEQTGNMVDALQRFLRYQEQLSAVRNRIISAAVYPALLLAVGTAVGLFLLCFLVPRFSHLYEGMDTHLPLASRLLMTWGQFVADHALVVSLGIGGGLAALIGWLRRPAAWVSLLGLLQRQRWLGEQLRLLQLSRFYRSLSLLLRGGIPALRGLSMVRGLLPPPLQARLDEAMTAIQRGQSLSDSLEQAGLTTAVALRLLRAGERNGQLAEMLERTAAFHDQEIGRWIDRFTRLFEPLLMLFIGGVIGGIVILLYLPIFELAGSIQ